MSSSDPNDMDTKLSSDPLRKKGFTNDLQRKIELAADRDCRSRRRRRPILLMLGASMTTAVLVFFFWHSVHTQNQPIMMQTASMPKDNQSTVSPPPPITSALLIGLRVDHKEQNPQRVLSNIAYSSYRTMLIAPQRGELQKTAEGTGILMPYKQNFWKIDALTHKTSQDEYHYLSTHLAGEPSKEENFKENPQEEIHHVETLVFAGNQYLSVAETEEAYTGNAPIRNDRIWVKKLPQLVDGRSLNFASHQADTRHVSLEDVFGNSMNIISDDLSPRRRLTGAPSEITGQSWTIARTAGRWVPRVAETYVPEGSHPEMYALHDFPRALPDKVVSHDALCCTWEDIQSKWPKATDALTSPMNDMVVIFEEGQLKFFPYGQASGGNPLLTVGLLPGEQLVMSQWATDHYVQEWIDKAGKYLAR